jgi:hypothetical protein
VVRKKTQASGFRLQGVFVFLLLLQTSCLAQEPNMGQATVSLQIEAQENDPYIWDFGTVKQGEVTEHAFTIKNDSSKTIRITGINTSCGCTASKANKEILIPGESAEITVTFKSKGYSGVVQQHAYVNTDDPDNPVIKLTIKAQVVK